VARPRNVQLSPATVDAEAAVGAARTASVDALSHTGPVACAYVNFRGPCRLPVARYAARLLRAEV